MVASSIASKGLDFAEIQHVINFSMPKEIEVSLSLVIPFEFAIDEMRLQDYVHQIGRTGRSGKTGIATTFVNMQTAEQTLLDLKYLLMEAKQKCVSSPLPPFSALTDLSQNSAFLGDDRRSERGRRRSIGLYELWRTRSFYYELSQVGGYGQAYCCGSSRRQGRGRILVASLSFVELHCFIRCTFVVSRKELDVKECERVRSE